MKHDPERLRNVGLEMFFFGAVGFLVFSMFFGGAALWKRIATMGFWAVSFAGVCVYAYALFQIWRGE